jgi:hypothetical protein
LVIVSLFSIGLALSDITNSLTYLWILKIIIFSFFLDLMGCSGSFICIYYG